MASHPLQDFIRRLRRARSVTEGDHLTDAQLLERFIRQRDEAAFEVLVWRHGTLVLNVARRLLRHVPDVEDVFQATFLTLARKASAIRCGTSLSSWLYKVAYHIALRVHQAAARRQRQQLHDLESAAPAEPGDAGLAIVLTEEVNRLPERYRAVVVLCYLQGVTTEEAARILGCPRGTVLSRLSSARQRLRRRLLRRGIAPAVALAAVSFGETASAVPSVALVTCVVRAALPFAAGGAAVPMESSQAAALAQGALQMMFWNKIKIVTVMTCMIALIGTGSSWLARSQSGAETPPLAAEPQGKKEGLREAAPDLAAKIKDEIKRIDAQLDYLAEKQAKEEEELTRESLEAQLDLAAAQDDLRLREQDYDLERERERGRIKAAELEVVRAEKIASDFEERMDKNAMGKAVFEESKNRLMKGVKSAESRYEEEKQRFLVREIQRAQGIRSIRKRVFQLESKIRHIEVVQARKQEEIMSRRHALIARLHQLEDRTLELQPADRLRDVERKLDTLRREVGELRRALERQGNDPRKKP
jgi:RNA polymerase sigma factor (sigma-70 family)